MGLTPDRSGSTVILSLIFPFVPVLVHKGKEKSLSFRYYFQPKACISVPLPSGVINLFRSLTEQIYRVFNMKYTKRLNAIQHTGDIKHGAKNPRHTCCGPESRRGPC